MSNFLLRYVFLNLKKKTVDHFLYVHYIFVLVVILVITDLRNVLYI